MSSFLFELWSTEKSYKVPFKEVSLYSSFVKSFDTLPKQKFYQIVLSFVLNVQISAFFTCKSLSSPLYCNLSKIFLH